jgi:hypothetical protein
VNLQRPGALDPIHLATAAHLASATAEALDAFVACDERVLATARMIGRAPLPSPTCPGRLKFTMGMGSASD